MRTKTAAKFINKYAKAIAEIQALDSESRADVLRELDASGVRDHKRVMWCCNKTKRLVTVEKLNEEERGFSLVAVWRQDGVMIGKMRTNDFVAGYTSCV